MSVDALQNIEQLEDSLWAAAEQAAGKMPKRPLVKQDFIRRRALMLPKEARRFSDYVVFVDETGDHSLESINEDYPLFGLSFCIFVRLRYEQREEGVIIAGRNGAGKTTFVAEPASTSEYAFCITVQGSRGRGNPGL